MGSRGRGASPDPPGKRNRQRTLSGSRTGASRDRADRRNGMGSRSVPVPDPRTVTVRGSGLVGDHIDVEGAGIPEPGFSALQDVSGSEDAWAEPPDSQRFVFHLDQGQERHGCQVRLVLGRPTPEQLPICPAFLGVVPLPEDFLALLGSVLVIG